MLCYVSFFGIGIKAMRELDEIHSLLFSYVAYLNGLGFTTNQSKHLLHFSILTVKICVLNNLFFFLKSCPNQARTCYYPLQMVLRQMLCSRRRLSSVCVRKGDFPGHCLKAALNMSLWILEQAPHNPAFHM